jgi:hypothetical protein
MNDLAAQLGLTPFSTSGIAMRIMATTADASMGSNVSDVIILSVTPYTTDSPKLWVPGNYAEDSGYGPNWSPDNDATPYLEAVEFGSTQYEGFIFMNVATPEFKLTPAMNWDNAYGIDPATSALVLGGSDNLTVAAPGYYYITVNTDPDGDPATDDATFTATPRVWGVIGSATEPAGAGWNDEADMTYDPATKLWSIDFDLTANELKFRAQQWDPAVYNLGLDPVNEGFLSFGGPNIPVAAAGRYRIELDLSTPRAYSFTLTFI